MLWVPLPGASRPIATSLFPGKTCLALPQPLPPTPSCPGSPRGACSSVVTPGRISSLALLKLGINRGLICIKHTLQREGLPFSPRWCGHGWDTGATDRHSVHITPQHSASSDHQEVVRGVLVSRESTGELGVVPALGSHCSRSTGRHSPLHISMQSSHGCSASSSALCLWGI